MSFIVLRCHEFFKHQSDLSNQERFYCAKINNYAGVRRSTGSYIIAIQNTAVFPTYAMKLDANLFK